MSINDLRELIINNNNEYAKKEIDYYHYKYKELQFYQEKWVLFLKRINHTDESLDVVKSTLIN